MALTLYTPRSYPAIEGRESIYLTGEFDSIAAALESIGANFVTGITPNITTNSLFTAPIYLGTAATVFATPFRTAPQVFLTLRGGASAQGGISINAESITATGFTAYGYGVSNGGVFKGCFLAVGV